MSRGLGLVTLSAFISKYYELLDTILKEQYILVYRMNQLRSYKYKMYSISIRKSAVHDFDSKRYICNDGVSTLAWGHYAIPK
jgi:hypothetical protein